MTPISYSLIWLGVCRDFFTIKHILQIICSPYLFGNIFPNIFSYILFVYILYYNFFMITQTEVIFGIFMKLIIII